MKNFSLRKNEGSLQENLSATKPSCEKKTP